MGEHIVNHGTKILPVVCINPLVEIQCEVLKSLVNVRISNLLFNTRLRIDS